MFLERLLGHRLRARARQRPSAVAPPLADIVPTAVGEPAHYKIPPRLRLMDTFPATVRGTAVGIRVAAARDLAAG